MNTLQPGFTLEERKREIIRLVDASLRAGGNKASDLQLAVIKANVSTAEIDEYFGGVSQLLIEMITAQTDLLLQTLAEDRLAAASLEDVLAAFGNAVTSAYHNSCLASLYRIALTEATRHTGVSREFFERGPGRLTKQLAWVLERHRRAGRVRDGDMHLRADHFLAILRDGLVVPGDRVLAPEDLDALVKDAVSLMCRGIKRGDA